MNQGRGAIILPSGIGFNKFVFKSIPKYVLIRDRILEDMRIGIGTDFGNSGIPGMDIQIFIVCIQSENSHIKCLGIANQRQWNG